MRSIPDDILKDFRKKLWELADNMGWLSLSDSEKSTKYKLWTEEPAIGGVLQKFMQKGQIRVYIKDTIMKGYARNQFSDSSRIMRVLRFDGPVQIVKEYTKPHGIVLSDNNLVCWGRAVDWKSVLGALHERAFGQNVRVPLAGVFLQSIGRFKQPSTRKMVEVASEKLGVKKIVWLED